MWLLSTFKEAAHREGDGHGGNGTTSSLLHRSIWPRQSNPSTHEVCVLMILDEGILFLFGRDKAIGWRPISAVHIRVKEMLPRGGGCRTIRLQSIIANVPRGGVALGLKNGPSSAKSVTMKRDSKSSHPSPPTILPIRGWNCQSIPCQRSGLSSIYNNNTTHET